MKRSEIFFGLIRIPVDFATALFAFFLAYRLRAQDVLIPFVQKPDPTVFPVLPEYFIFASYAASALLIILAGMGMYSLRSTDSVPREMKKIIIGVTIWLMAVITYYFVIRSFPFSRLVLLYSFVFAMLCLALGRLGIRSVQSALLRRGIGKRHIVFVGNNAVAKQLVDVLTASGRYTVAGVINSFATLPVFITRHVVEEVIQTKEIDDVEAADILNFCREHHIRYHFVPSLLEVQRTNVDVSNIGGIPIISLLPTRLDGWGKVLKRSFDIFSSFFGLLLLSPVFALIAIAIRIDSRGPVFFRYLDDGSKAKRVGQFGKKFPCIKFRTMKNNTHGMRYSEEFAELNKRKGSPLVKIQNDPRVTVVGKFLRKYSIDELPQLWNVLVGTMSLVGPRPHLPEEVAKYEKHHKFVLTIKPGITGLAQINGRSDLGFEEEVELDTYYIENWSL
ncbi:MAG: sugar transferase, partial [Patescibacteria group bacterium]